MMSWLELQGKRFMVDHAHKLLTEDQYETCIDKAASNKVSSGVFFFFGLGYITTALCNIQDLMVSVEEVTNHTNNPALAMV